MTDADYADHLELLSNTPVQSNSLQYSLEQAAGETGLYMNANKTEFMYFKQGASSTLYGKPLKFVDQFTCLSSYILSTEINFNIH